MWAILCFLIDERFCSLGKFTFWANLEWAILHFGQFCSLSDLTFWAILEWAILERAILEWAILEWAILEWAILEWAILHRHHLYTHVKRGLSVCLSVCAGFGSQTTGWISTKFGLDLPWTLRMLSKNFFEGDPLFGILEKIRKLKKFLNCLKQKVIYSNLNINLFSKI